ncbi:hypothetical protein K3495_g1546 [Podosphaera aphanis]|nr:hypothetical protein K3495_g1546 [Podosphaera aphanis]
MSPTTSAPPTIHPLRAHPVDPNELVHKRSPSQISEKKLSESKLPLKTGENSKNLIARINVPLSEFAKDCVKLEEKVLQTILAGSKKIKTPKIKSRQRSPKSNGTVSIVRISAELGDSKKDRCIIVHKEIGPSKKPSRYIRENRAGHSQRHSKPHPISSKRYEKPSQILQAERRKIDLNLERENIEVVDFAYQLKFKKSGPPMVTEIRQA